MTFRLLVFSLLGVVLALFLAVDPLNETPTNASAPLGAPDQVWADLDCNGAANGPDALVVLADKAGVPSNQAEFCPIAGTPVSPGGGASVPWGDLNCDGVVDLLDVMLLLNSASGGQVNTGACPDVGEEIAIQQLAGAYEIDPGWDDFGDAPNGTPTGYSSGAAIGAFPSAEGSGAPYHQFESAAWLGESETVEDAPNLEDAGDDGLVFLDLFECETSSALIAINTAGIPPAELGEPLYLSAWADWNRDGEWDGQDSCAPEAAVVNQPVNVSSDPDSTVFAMEFTGGAQVDEFWMRVTLTRQPFSGAFPDEMEGETEDYLVVNGQPTPGPFASAQPAGLAQPQNGNDGAGRGFVCKGGAIPHGNGQKLTLDIEQTTASKANLNVKNVKMSIPQPVDEKGKKVGGNPVAGSTSTLSNLPDGRLRIRLEVTVNTEAHEVENAMVGPWKLAIEINGKDQNNKEFSGGIICALYVEHSLAATAQNPDTDGFYGGPGRTAAPGEVGEVNLFFPHDKTFVISTDANQTAEEQRGSKIDKTSLTVFGTDGKPVPKNKWKSDLGIKDIEPSATGRGLKITPAKDTRTEKLVRIVFRVNGKLADGTTPFTDYFRVVIVHESGAKANKLVKDYSESNVAYNYTTHDEGQATFLGYVADNTQLVYQSPPEIGLTFDPETLCAVTTPERLRDVGFGTPGTSFTTRYANGNGDIFNLPELPEDDGPGVDCTEIATNVTGFGPASPYLPTNGGACGESFVFTEYNLQAQTHRQGIVDKDGAAFGLGPVPGGTGMEDSACYERTDGSYRLTGAVPGALAGTSDGAILECKGCPGEETTSIQGLPAPVVIIEAEGANSHIYGLVVSPDLTKIAWQLAILTENGQSYVDSQIWVADFDTETLAVTNRTQLTEDGLNFTPAWSPDSSQIAFISSQGNLDVWVMDADGGNKTNVTNTPAISETYLAWQAP